jgi:mono/diheme cytochrome c family protein
MPTAHAIAPRVLLPALLLGSAVACRSFEHDPVEVVSRYSNRIAGNCPSYLHSSVTGIRYCASPPVKVAYTPPKSAIAPVVEAPIDVTKVDQASLMARGEKVYGDTCSTCHGVDGKGIAGAFPPLAGSGAFYGDARNHATIVVNGLSGTITVQGVEYTGAMPPQSALSDYDLAAAMTYERNSWGNADGIVLPDDVKAVRPAAP